MDDARSASLLQRLGELERDDAELAAAIERVADVTSRADALRARATEIVALLAAMPGERAHLDETAASAQDRVVAARRELEEAERRLADVEGGRRARDEQKAQARREAVAARDGLAAVEAHRTRIVERRIALDEDELVLRAEGEGLAISATVIAAEINLIDGVSASGRTVPGSALAALDDWGARAHAALFVVRGGLETRQERVVSEANALAAGALLESLAATRVVDIRRRVEAALS